jgi:hypothetical protein
LGHAVTLEFVGDDHAGFVVQSLQEPLEESFCRLRVPPRQNQYVEDDAILINDLPKIVTDSLNSDEHLVHVPLVTWPRPAAAHAVGEGLTELLAPAPYGLVGHRHAPLGENQLNVPETAAE